MQNADLNGVAFRCLGDIPHEMVRSDTGGQNAGQSPTGTLQDTSTADAHDSLLLAKNTNTPLSPPGD
jgi:hypothetical protein